MKNPDGMIENLRGQMKVTNFPSDERGLGRCLELNLIDGLWQLPDDIVASRLLEDDAAVSETGFKVEPELRAILREATPAALEKLPTLGSEGYLACRRKSRRFRQHSLDQVHHWWMNESCSIVDAS